jgi:hypothetical protein
MSDTMKYWEEQTFEPKEEEESSEDVVNILDLYRLLSVENKLKVRNLLRNVEIF